MKSMKKIICGLAAAVMLTVCALPVFAAGINSHEKAVLDELRAGATVDGIHYNIPSQYINQAENWLNSSYDMTEEQANEVLSYIREAREIAVASGAKDFDQMSAATRQKLLNLAQKAAAVVGLKLTVVNGKTVVITDANGVTVFKADAVIKATGGQAADATNVVILALVVVGTIAAAGFGARKLKVARA